MSTTSDDVILAKIEQNVREEGDCRIWGGVFKNKRGYPSTRVLRNGKIIDMDIQRYLWNLNHESLRRSDTLQLSCKDHRCINIDHFILKSKTVPPNYTSTTGDILEIIERHVKIEDSCKIWTGYTRRKQPLAVRRINGKQVNVDVQRFLWEMINPRLRHADQLSTSCGNDYCVSIDHLVLTDTLEINWESVYNRILSHTRNEGDCLIWTGSISARYGVTSIKRNNILAHRAVYRCKINGAEIPPTVDGMISQVRHTCNNTLCVKKEHLVLGSISENNYEDKIKNGTLPRGEKSYNSKITEEIASKVKRSKRGRGEDGYETQKQRAKRFGVSLGTVSSIDRGASWAYVKDRDGNEHSTAKRRKTRREQNLQARSREWGEEEYEKATEILYSRIEKSPTCKKCDIPGECWNYTGYCQGGYGMISLFGRQFKAHGLSCEIKTRRRRDDKEVVRHICGNSRCINPQHIEYSSQQTNAYDMLIHGTSSAKLDANKVREIRDSSLSTRELSQKYKVNERTIRSVITRTTWKHIE